MNNEITLKFRNKQEADYWFQWYIETGEASSGYMIQDWSEHYSVIELSPEGPKEDSTNPTILWGNLPGV